MDTTCAAAASVSQSGRDANARPCGPNAWTQPAAATVTASKASASATPATTARAARTVSVGLDLFDLQRPAIQFLEGRDFFQVADVCQ